MNDKSILKGVSYKLKSKRLNLDGKFWHSTTKGMKKNGQDLDWNDIKAFELTYCD